MTGHINRQKFEEYTKHKKTMEKDFIDTIGVEKADQIDVQQWKDLKSLTRNMADVQLENLYGKMGDYHKARLNGCKAHGATAWITANLFPYSKFTNTEFIITAYIWLGIPITNEEVNCRYCQTRMDKYGAHAAVCMFGSNRIRRHNRLRQYIYRKMKEAGYTYQLEKRNLATKDGKKPAGIFVDSLVNNQPTAIDVAVTSPL